jgi:hypothetical protein
MRSLFAAAVKAAKELLATQPMFTVQYQDKDGISYMAFPAQSREHAKKIMMQVTQKESGIHILKVFAPGEIATPRAAKDEYFSGGFDIMKKLQKKLVKEQKKSWTNPDLEKAFDKMSLPKGTFWFKPRSPAKSDPGEPELKPGDHYKEWTGTEWIEKTYKG